MSDATAKKKASTMLHELKAQADQSSSERTHSQPSSTASVPMAEAKRAQPSSTASVPMAEARRAQPEYTAQNGHASENGSQTQTLTLTEQVRLQLPTLILILRNVHAEKLKHLSEKEQEAYITQHVNAFRDMLIRNIDNFHAIVKSARPPATAAGQPDYAEQRAMYCELLRVATGLLGNMQTTINEVLTNYRIFIEDLWEAICNGKDPAPITQKFQRDTEAYMKQTWDPVFSKADKMMDDIEKARKQ